MHPSAVLLSLLAAALVTVDAAAWSAAADSVWPAPSAILLAALATSQTSAVALLFAAADLKRARHAAALACLAGAPLVLMTGVAAILPALVPLVFAFVASGLWAAELSIDGGIARQTEGRARGQFSIAGLLKLTTAATCYAAGMRHLAQNAVTPWLGLLAAGLALLAITIAWAVLSRGGLLPRLAALTIAAAVLATAGGGPWSHLAALHSGLFLLTVVVLRQAGLRIARPQGDLGAYGVQSAEAWTCLGAEPRRRAFTRR